MNKMNKVLSSFFILVWFWIWGICFRKLDYINYASTCVVCTLPIYLQFELLIQHSFNLPMCSSQFGEVVLLVLPTPYCIVGEYEVYKVATFIFQKISKKKLAIFSNNFQTPLTITTHSSPDCLGKFFLSFFLHNLKIIKTLTKLRILPFSQTTFTDKCTVLLNSPARQQQPQKK